VLGLKKSAQVVVIDRVGRNSFWHEREAGLYQFFAKWPIKQLKIKLILSNASKIGLA
jgi:hypothetical protein